MELNRKTGKEIKEYLVASYVCQCVIEKYGVKITERKGDSPYEGHNLSMLDDQEEFLIETATDIAYGWSGAIYPVIHREGCKRGKLIAQILGDKKEKEIIIYREISDKIKLAGM